MFTGNWTFRPFVSSPLDVQGMKRPGGKLTKGRNVHKSFLRYTYYGVLRCCKILHCCVNVSTEILVTISADIIRGHHYKIHKLEGTRESVYLLQVNFYSNPF